MHDGFVPLICEELALTARWLEQLSGPRQLLEHDPRPGVSIRRRDCCIDPIRVPQLDLLQRWRESGHEDEGSL
ncbi:MAG: phosphoenolpyruvate carboxylase [Stenotrophomonas sp.]